MSDVLAGEPAEVMDIDRGGDVDVNGNRDKPTEYLSTSEAAAKMGLSPRTLDRYRVSFRLEDERMLSLNEGDPQLHPLDHAWASTVHAY